MQTPEILCANKVSPVECLLCLPVLQIYYDCVYLHRKFILTAGICTLCVYSVAAGPFVPFCLLVLFASMSTGSSSGSGSDSDSDNDNDTSSSDRCSEQDNIVTVSDDSE